MKIILSDETVIEVLNINLEKNYIDWKRIGEGYSGDCKTDVELSSFESALDEMTAALEAELGEIA